MKLLYIANLFSGLKESVKRNIWSPEGVPTVYNFLNNLNTSFDESEILFLSSDNDIKEMQSYYIKNLDTPIFIFKKKIQTSFRIYNYIIFFLLFFRIFFFIRKSKPDIIYIDRANFLLAILFKIFTKKKIVWRLMGVTLPLHRFTSSNKLSSYIFRLFLKIKLDLVICTQDGSGGKEWMDRYLNKKTKKIILINGYSNYFDSNNNLEKSNHILFDKTYMNLLFVSRLVEGKGCLELINSFNKLIKSKLTNLRLIVIGEGPLKNKMFQSLKENNIEKYATFTGSMKHDEVIKCYKFADVYISLNEMGSLINSNLEAIKSNNCMIIPESLDDFYIDKFTDNLIPDNCIIRIPRLNISDNLFEKIQFLYNERSQISVIKKNIETLNKNFLIPWDQRIYKEYDIIKNLFK